LINYFYLILGILLTILRIFNFLSQTHRMFVPDMVMEDMVKKVYILDMLDTVETVDIVDIVDTVDKVDTVDTVYTVDTVETVDRVDMVFILDMVDTNFRFLQKRSP
jgi:hypothetical protein